MSQERPIPRENWMGIGGLLWHHYIARNWRCHAQSDPRQFAAKSRNITSGGLWMPKNVCTVSAPLLPAPGFRWRYVMIRKILAVIAGFLVWSTLWVAANATLRAAGLLPPPDQAVTAPATLALLLVASVLASLVAGFLVSFLARGAGQKIALWLGALLLAFGVFVQTQYWSLMPVWYHLAFLLLLIPMCVAGSRLRPDNSSKPTSLRGPA